MARKNMASMAYRIVSTGVDLNVPVYTRNRVEKVIEGKTLNVLETTLTGEKEKSLAYADIVIMNDAKPEAYDALFRWYKASIGKSYAQAKEVKPTGMKLPVVKQMRVYYYHKDSVTVSARLQGVVGWKELIGQLKMSPETAAKVLATGDSGVVGALKVLNLFKAQHDQGKHFTVLGSVKTDLSIKRGIFAYLLDTKSFLWDGGKGSNRSSHLWKEEVHGEIVRRMIEHSKLLGGVDTALDWTNDLADLLDDVPEETVSVEGTTIKMNSTGKWVEETYLDAKNKEIRRYISPSGEIIDRPPLGCFDRDVQAKYNAAMVAYDRQENPAEWS